MYNNEYQQQNKYIYEKCIFDANVSKIPIAPPILTGGINKNYSDLPLLKFDKNNPFNIKYPILIGGDVDLSKIPLPTPTPLESKAPLSMPLPTPIKIPVKKHVIKHEYDDKYYINTIFNASSNYENFIKELKDYYPNYQKFLLNELKKNGTKFNIQTNNYNLIKNYYEYLYVNKKEFHEPIELKPIIEKILLRQAKRELRRENNENLINIRNNPNSVKIDEIKVMNEDIKEIEKKTNQYIEIINRKKIDIESYDKGRTSSSINKNHQYQDYIKLKLEVTKYSLSIKNFIDKILKNKLIYLCFEKNKETISPVMIESLKNINNILNKERELQSMINNYIKTNLISKIEIEKQIKMYNHYLRPLGENRNENNIEDILENLNDYIDLSHSNYFENSINKSQNNNFGIWVILKASTFDTKYIFQKSSKPTDTSLLKDITKLSKKIYQKMTSVNYNGKGTQNCYSLFNILNGQLIYCMGNINRNKFYNKIYKDKGTMFKIPGICNPNEINGPIIGVNQKIEGDNKSEFNYNYFKLSRIEDFKDVITKEGIYILVHL